MKNGDRVRLSETSCGRGLVGSLRCYECAASVTLSASRPLRETKRPYSPLPSYDEPACVSWLRHWAG